MMRIVLEFIGFLISSILLSFCFRFGENEFTSRSEAEITLLWFFAVAPALVLLCLTLLYIYSKRKANAAQKIQKYSKRSRKKHSRSAEAREVQHERLNLKEFKDKGPLVMQYSFSGDVKHALQDVRSSSIKNIVFDTAQNSIVRIGTEVERLEGAPQLTERTQIDEVNVDHSAEEMKAYVFTSGTSLSVQEHKVQKSSQNSSTTLRDSV